MFREHQIGCSGIDTSRTPNLVLGRHSLEFSGGFRILVLLQHPARCPVSQIRCSTRTSVGVIWRLNLRLLVCLVIPGRYAKRLLHGTHKIKLYIYLFIARNKNNTSTNTTNIIGGTKKTPTHTSVRLSSHIYE